jgi:hypothetical protein
MILTEVFYGGPEAWGLRCALAALRRDAITCTVGTICFESEANETCFKPFWTIYIYCITFGARSWQSFVSYKITYNVSKKAIHQMKKILIVYFLLVSQTLLAQVTLKGTYQGAMVELVDINGRPMQKKYDAEITGHPFLGEDVWILAKMTTFKDKETPAVLVKLNIESNEIYYKDTSGFERIALDGWIKKISFLNWWDEDSLLYVFKNGYPAVDQQKEQFYYQVCTAGKIELLKKYDKSITTYKNDMSGEVTKSFVARDRLYIFANGAMQVFKNDKKMLLGLMQDKEVAINEYLNTHKINFKKKKDLVELIEYYNGLK